jgi:hypothetical protein
MTTTAAGAATTGQDGNNQISEEITSAVSSSS